MSDKELAFEFEFSTDTVALEKTIQQATEEGGKWVVEGYAATSDIDLDYDTISKDALIEAAENLKELSTVLFNHDKEQPIGKVLDAKALDEGKLWVKVLISKSEPKRWQQIQEGVISKFSVRGRILKHHETTSKELNKRVRVVDKVKLVETSLVSIPANPKAQTLRWYIEKALTQLPEVEQVAENKKIETLDDLENLLKEAHTQDEKNESLRSALEFLAEVKKAASEIETPSKDEDGTSKNTEEISADELGKTIAEQVIAGINESLSKSVSDVITPLVDEMKSLSKVPGTLETMTTALTALTEKAFKSGNEEDTASKKIEGIEKSLGDLKKTIDSMPVRKGNKHSTEDDNPPSDDPAQGPVDELIKSEKYQNDSNPSSRLSSLLGVIMAQGE